MFNADRRKDSPDSHPTGRPGRSLSTSPSTVSTRAKGLRVLLVVAATVASTAFVMAPSMASEAMPPDTQAPTEPGTIAVSSVTSSGAFLSWAGSKDNVSIEGYRIWRGLNGGPMSIIYTNDAIDNFTAVNLRSNSTYQFGVTAIDSANNQSPMQTTTLTTPSTTDTTTPSPPSDASLSIKAFSSTRLDVVWGNSPSADVSYFEVFRNGVQIATVDRPNAPHYSDNGLTPSTQYSYFIKAVDSAGNVSAPTTTKSMTTTAPGFVQIARGPVLSNVLATSAIVSWWTNIPTSGVLAVSGRPSITDPAGVTQHHVVTVTGLTAATVNSYTVTSVDPTTSKTASLSGSITTAALPGQTFSFAAMGDYGGGGPGEVENAANIKTAGTQFIQTLGDNIYPSAGLPDPDFATTYSDFDSHFYKELGQDVDNQAFFPANGNKDYYSDGQFWVNFPMLGTNHEWYSYNWGDAHILVLDSEEPMGVGSDQYAFVQNDLATNQSQKWRIVAIQRPPYSSTTANSSSKLAAVFVPMFQAYRVNLVLSGNSHNYERSFPLTNGVQDDANGVTYIVSGGGGSGFDKFTTGFSEPTWSAFRESDYFEFAKITVSPTSIVESAIRADAPTTFMDGTTINPLPADTTAPSAPTGLAATGPTTSSVPLSWTPNPMAEGVTGYDVFRNGTKIGSASGITTTFTDSGVTAGTTYQYAIDAHDGSGNTSPLGTSVAVTTPSSGQASIVQSAGSSTKTVTLAKPSSQGNLLVLSASVFTGGSQQITSVTDTAGNTWTKAGAYTVTGKNADGELWYAANAMPVTSVTVTEGATTVALSLQEFRGVVATNPLDAAIGAADTGTAATSGSATPTAPGDLAVGFVAGHSSTQAISISSPGYILQDLQTSTSPSKAEIQTGYQLLASSGAQSLAATFPAAMYWSDGLALFKTSGSSSPPANDFSISAAPPAGTVTAGSTGSSAISTSTTSGSAQSVALSATGQPSGVTVSFSPAAVTSGATGSTMTVSTSTAVAQGTYPLTVTGTAASGSHSATFTLTVNRPVASTPRLVQWAGATEAAAATTLIASFPAPTASGNLLVLSVSEDTGATNHVASVTDSAGNTWTRIGAVSVAGHNSEGEMWYSVSAAPVTTVTVHTATAASLAFAIQEFAGVATTSPLDTMASASNTSTVASSGPVASAVGNELAVGYVAGHASKQAITPTNAGYTTQPQQTNTGTASNLASVITGYQVLTSPGSLAFTGTFPAAMYWASGIALFRPAS
jgi:hypothetical protein